MKLPTVARPRVAIFDYNITQNSPAGSCVLAEVAGLCDRLDITVFADRFQNPDSLPVRWIRVPLPNAPGSLKDWLFAKLAPIFYWLEARRFGRFDLVQTTQGHFRKCDIAYAHFCHKAYLREHWHIAGARGVRRLVRWFSHQRNAYREAKAFTQAKVVVVPSKGLEAELVRTYPWLRGRTICIPNPVSSERFSRPVQFDPLPTRQDFGFSANDFVMSFVALGDFARKGLRVLLEAMVGRGTHTAKLLVVGGTPSEIAQYRAIAAALGLEGKVAFTGFRRDVRPYLWSSDIFVFPSLYETFCLAAFQAALAGLPILATPVYGVEEILQDGINGWVIQRDVDSVRLAVQKALADPSKLMEMGRAARKAAERYSPEAFVERWRMLYGRLLVDDAPTKRVPA